MTTDKILFTAFTCLILPTVGCSEQNVTATHAPKEEARTQLASMVPFKCQTSLVGEDNFQSTIFFRDQFAIEFDPNDETKVALIYDLDELSWQDPNARRKVTIEDCEKWAQASKEMSQESLSKVSDPQIKRFAARSLDPKFEVTKVGDAITLANDVMTYRVSNPMRLDAQQFQRFFAYDRLNAYRKAMEDRKLPPFPQLAVDKVLEERKFVPGKIEFSIATPNGDVDLTVTVRVTRMTEAEVSRVAEAIISAGGT